MGVDHRHLPDGPRPGEGQLSAGRDVAEQQVRHGRAALRPGVPDVEDRRHVLHRPAQVERASVHHQQDHRRTGGDHRLQQVQLPAGQLERGAGGRLADHLLPLAEHHDGQVAVAGQVDRPSLLGLVVEVLRVGRGVAREHVEHRGEHPLRRPDPRRVTDLGPLAQPAPQPVQHGHRLVQVEVEAPRAQGVAPGVRQGSDHRQRAQAAGVQREQAALVAQQHRRPLGGQPGDVAVRRVGQHLPGSVLVDVRVLEQAEPKLGRQDPADAGVDGLLGHRPALDRLGQVSVRRVRHRHLQVEPDPHSPRRGVGEVGGEAVGDQAAHGVGVADHEAVETPLLPEHLGEQPAVAGGGHPVEVHVRRHHVAGSGGQRRLERREVHVPELVVGQVDLVVVPAAEGCPVTGEVLGSGDHPLRRTEPLALESPDLGRRHRRAEVGVLTRSLHDPAPARVTRDVHHGGEGPVDPDGARLAGRDRLTPLDRRQVPRRRHGDRHREDGAQPVDDIEPEQRRDVLATAIDGHPLQPVYRGRIGLEEQGPAPTPGQCLVHLPGGLRCRADGGLGRAEVEVLAELTGLLSQGHRPEQLLDPGLDRSVLAVGHGAPL